MSRWNRLFKFSPFKAGGLIVLLSCALFLSFDERKPELIAALDSRGVDTMFRLRGPLAIQDRVVIVDIDEKSLQELGQWPWPRDTLADLITAIRDAGPRVLGLDMVFAEADRTSPHRALPYIARRAPHIVPPEAVAKGIDEPELDNDRRLGEALAETPAVLGYVFQTRNDGLKRPEDIPFPSANLGTAPGGIPFDALRIPTVYRAVVNVPAVATAPSEGFFNVFPESSGMVHKVPLLLQMDGIPYPSLALEMVRIGRGEQDLVIHASQVSRGGKRGLLGIGLGNHFIPTDDFGQVMVNYRGSVGSFPYVPAVEVLNGAHRDLLQDRYVLLGTTAAGLHDLRATPFSAIFPGVEIHATVIDNILANDLLTHDLMAERGLTFLLIVAGGLLLSALLAYGSPLLGGLAGLCFLVASLAGNYLFLFKSNHVVGLTYPLLVILTIFSVVTLFNYVFVGREKRFIDRAFSRYISPQVVQQLKRDPSQLTLSGEEKTLTILFCDVRDFTALSERMSALQLGRFMNRYLTAMSREILSRRGTVDKFVGDAIMAIWGAPLKNPEQAADSVRAALAMCSRLPALNEGWEREGLPAVRIGIGINTGVASVGNFGSDERFDYTVIGDEVNLASRLEGVTKLYGASIVISEATRIAIGEKFFCRWLDRVRVKGKTRPIVIYEPLLEGEAPDDLREEVVEFELALRDYFAGDWDAAEARLQCLETHRSHPRYQLYLQRVATRRKSTDWDGVTTLDAK